MFNFIFLRILVFILKVIRRKNSRDSINSAIQKEIDKNDLIATFNPNHVQHSISHLITNLIRKIKPNPTIN